jgi:AraC family transcriptional regulator of adaptative response / DNA-3-methyladenine glycosylase II
VATRKARADVISVAMGLDERVCDRARLARDPRFDGRFYIAVLSTGIYCRPICPSPVALRANVRYFPTGEEAAAAGFRPCLRCRPTAVPGTPAWSGTSTTVSRALRLIAEGALEVISVPRLSERLGVTSRHLNRLFRAHLGMSVADVTRTWRLRRAHEVVRKTDAPMSRVAAEAGFRSVRRFNDEFRKRFGEPPSQLRRARPKSGGAQTSEYVARLAFTPPYDWRSQLAFLKKRAIPGVERVVSGTFRRTFTLEGKQGTFEVGLEPGASALTARVRCEDPVALLAIVKRLRVMFDVAVDPSVVARHFRDDALLAPLVKRHPGLRIPGSWDRLEGDARAPGDPGDPDAFPAHDATLRRVAGNGRPLTPLALERLSETWRPWRGYAAALLWRAARARRSRPASTARAPRRRTRRTR